MTRQLVVASIAVFMVLGAPALAEAKEDDNGGGNHENGGDGPKEHHHGGAPEPLTAIGLALGAGGIAAARWASRRKSKSPQ